MNLHKKLKKVWNFCKNNKFWFSLGVVAICSPFIIEVSMTGMFKHPSGISNDAWLAFWGVYLGIMISIAGVYRSVKTQHEDSQKNMIHNSRPVVRSTTQYGIKVNDRVYHSTTSIDFDRFASDFFRVENVSERPALDIFFAVYGIDSHQPVDIVTLPSLTDRAVLVSYRSPILKKGEIFHRDRIEIAYKTMDEEVGVLIQKFTNDETLILPKTIWGSKAKSKYELLERQFNEHNRENAKWLADLWHQYSTIFTEQDIKYYEKVRTKFFNNRNPTLASVVAKVESKDNNDSTKK